MLAGGVVQAANDQKVYSGTSCVEAGSGTPSIRYGTAFAFHTAASSKIFICPAVKDGVASATWFLTVDRNGATAAWPVTMVLTNEAGDTGNTSIINVAAGNGVKTAIPGPSLMFFRNLGQMFLISSVTPANARIHSFMVNEGMSGDAI
jgi:hypothetical protein